MKRRPAIALTKDRPDAKPIWPGQLFERLPGTRGQRYSACLRVLRGGGSNYYEAVLLVDVVPSQQLGFAGPEPSGDQEPRPNCMLGSQLGAQLVELAVRECPVTGLGALFERPEIGGWVVKQVALAHSEIEHAPQCYQMPIHRGGRHGVLNPT